MAFTYRTITFPEYLEAKFQVDSSSINDEVARRFHSAITENTDVRLLDAGSGTAAVLRRLVAQVRIPSLHYTALDTDGENRRHAIEGSEAFLKGEGYSCTVTKTGAAGRLLAKKGELRIDAQFVTGDLFNPPETNAANQYDAITAHALLDVLPLKDAVRSLAALLRPGGILYSAINYDGTTTFVPEYEDSEFETELLRTYDRSMDVRLVRDLPTGGSRTGTRVARALTDSGFGITGFGPSDWSVFPWEASYRDREAIFLLAIVQMIAEEGTRHANIDTGRLDAWFRDRAKCIEGCELGLVAHQTDILGVLKE